jgi:hypothetical protein
VVLADGETVIELPVPTCVPPQLPEYQTQPAPVPSEPPTLVSVVEPPLQIGFVEEVMDVGATDRVFTVTVTLAQVVVLQVPTART